MRFKITLNDLKNIALGFLALGFLGLMADRSNFKHDMAVSSAEHAFVTIKANQDSLDFWKEEARYWQEVCNEQGQEIIRLGSEVFSLSAKVNQSIYALDQANIPHKINRE